MGVNYAYLPIGFTSFKDFCDYAPDFNAPTKLNVKISPIYVDSSINIYISFEFVHFKQKYN